MKPSDFQMTRFDTPGEGSMCPLTRFDTGFIFAYFFITPCQTLFKVMCQTVLNCVKACHECQSMPKHMKNPLRDMFWIGMDIDIHRSLKPCLRFLAGSISCRSMHMVAPSCVTSLHKDLTPNRGKFYSRYTLCTQAYIYRTAEYIVFAQNICFTWLPRTALTQFSIFQNAGSIICELHIP